MNVSTLQSRLVQAGYSPGPLDGLFGPQTLRALCERIAGKGSVDLEEARAMWVAMRAQDITTPRRIIHFLANCGAETRFRITEENLSYSAERMTKVWPERFPTVASARPYAYNPQALADRVYMGRMGNDRPGDGWRYRGRGWAQLTGREGYREVGRIVGLPLETDPDLVLTVPGNALAAAGFWTWKGLAPYADRDDVLTVRRMWNGGLHGLPAVREAVAIQRAMWGLA